MSEFRSRAKIHAFQLGEHRASLPGVLLIDIGDGRFISMPTSRFAPDVWLIPGGKFLKSTAYQVLSDDEFRERYEPVAAG